MNRMGKNQESSWESSLEFSDLDKDIVQLYKKYMESGLDIITKHKLYFLRDSKIPTVIKIEKIMELIDFLILEGNGKKLLEIYEIKKSLKIKLMIEKKLI